MNDKEKQRMDREWQRAERPAKARGWFDRFGEFDGNWANNGRSGENTIPIRHQDGS